MKRFLLLFVFSAIIAISQAQENHFTFRDIPINGSAQELGEKLEKLGYEPSATGNSYKGKFIGDDCKVFLLESDYTNNVYSVVVNFDSQTSWFSLKSKFNKIREMYSDKYGKPSREVHAFYRPYYAGDGYELSAIKLGKCNYISEWNVENGSIMLTIIKDGSIAIYYNDTLNEELNDKAKEKSAKEEI